MNLATVVTSTAPAAPAVSSPRILRIFVSYASEDLKLAFAIRNALHMALGEPFAEVIIDKLSLEAGEEFRNRLKEKLAASDILIIVHTGAIKQSFSYTGWEAGFFEGVMDAAKSISGEGKRIIPMYLETAPDAAAGYQGIGLNIPRPLLQLSLEAFKARNDVRADDPMCLLIQKLQDEVDQCVEAAGFRKNLNKPDPVECFRNMRLEIFGYLKTTVEAALKPQKQITVRSTGRALRGFDADLPMDAELIPMGTGNPMGIFGLPDERITWETFLQSVSGAHKDSWRDAIAAVVNSFVQNLNVDNGQIILSSDETKSYRIILTTATRFFDDSQEFNLYFVEVLQREEYGDRDTTLLLKGLEVVCRYRFMFLERDSKFTADNILITRLDRLPDIASELLRELNLMRRDLLNAGLDQPSVWSNFVDWEKIHQMATNYEPAEESLRSHIGSILQARDSPGDLARLRQQLSVSVRTLASVTRPQNTLLIEAMSQQLQALVRTIQQDSLQAARELPPSVVPLKPADEGDDTPGDIGALAMAENDG